MNRTIVDRLEDVKKFGVIPEQDKRFAALMNDLFNLIPISQYSKIEHARKLWASGWGRSEFDQVCNDLIQKYRHDPPERKTLVTL